MGRETKGRSWVNSHRRLRISLVRIALWLALPLALAFALRGVSLAGIGAIVSRLGLVQIAVLAVVNLGVIAAFAGRWWVILAADGYRIPYGALTLYRLAAFSISYFTPGTQFGGEPLQVYLLGRRHAIPASTAAASVVLDRALEMVVNFAFLALGMGVVLRLGVYPRGASTLLAGAAILLLVVPAGYLIAVGAGHRPGSRVLERVVSRLRRAPWIDLLSRFFAAAEDEVNRLARRRPKALMWGLLASGASWVAMLAEWWLATAFLGFPLDPLRLIAVVTASRLAFLVPLPGALGALEASLVLSLTALGFRTEQALGLALLIRVRDVAFGAAGLWLGGALAAPLKEDQGAGR